MRYFIIFFYGRSTWPHMPGLEFSERLQTSKPILLDNSILTWACRYSALFTSPQKILGSSVNILPFLLPSTVSFRARARALVAQLGDRRRRRRRRPTPRARVQPRRFLRQVFIGPFAVDRTPLLFPPCRAKPSTRTLT